MNTLVAILAIVSLLVGTVFLFAAALGVYRFADPLQRMHATTKAGTVGAVFTLIGAMLVEGKPDGLLIGMLTIAFLMLTVPVAAHVLGRAIYVSGAPLTGLEGKDALAGKLPRQQASIAQFENLAAASDAPATMDQTPLRQPQPDMPRLSEIRFALIGPDVDGVVLRAAELARRSKLPLVAFAIIDEHFISATRSPRQARALIRERAGQAVARLHELMPADIEHFSLIYEEGDPMEIIPDRGQDLSLLILPQKGWCHHGVEMLTPAMTGRPEGLLRLPEFHRGPVLYCRDSTATASRQRIAVIDDGSEQMIPAIAWTARQTIWQEFALSYIGPADDGRLLLIEEALAGTKAVVSVERAEGVEPAYPLPSAFMADKDMLITRRLPVPRRTDWYGQPWTEQIAKGWRGEVFLVSPDIPQP